jgi:hypothetical protein
VNGLCVGIQGKEKYLVFRTMSLDARSHDHACDQRVPDLPQKAGREAGLLILASYRSGCLAPFRSGSRLVLWYPDRDWRPVAVQLRVGSSGRPAAELEGAAAGRDAHWGVMAKLSDALGCAFGLTLRRHFLVSFAASNAFRARQYRSNLRPLQCANVSLAPAFFAPRGRPRSPNFSGFPWRRARA